MAPTSANASLDNQRPVGAAQRRDTASLHQANKHPLRKTAKARYSRPAGLQCVPFARAASGIALKGNAVNWWDAAAGIYQRGSRPEVGAVLNFRATGGMRLGHVAVVTSVLGTREVEIDHANWGGWGAKGNISRGAHVIDVSDRNDWSAVRVELGHSGDYGNVYPTYGFIYDRPDTGTALANDSDNGLRMAADRPALGGPDAGNEVAEVPPQRAAMPVRGSGMEAGGVIPASLPLDAPQHSLR